MWSDCVPRFLERLDDGVKEAMSVDAPHAGHVLEHDVFHLELACEPCHMLM